MKLDKLNSSEDGKPAVKILTREQLLSVQGGTTGTLVHTLPKSIMLAETADDHGDDYGD
jgi:hypothetical protein